MRIVQVGAKNPTQRKRVSKFEKIDWDKDKPLPAAVPELYMTYVMKRKFKYAVCSFVQDQIVDLVDLSGNRRLIIDWVGPPTQYARDGVDMPPQTGFSQGLGEV